LSLRSFSLFSNDEWLLTVDFVDDRMDEDIALTNISMQMRATVRRPRRRIFSELSDDVAIENLLLTNDE
jgi:hypothetical protein